MFEILKTILKNGNQILRGGNEPMRSETLVMLLCLIALLGAHLIVYISARKVARKHINRLNMLKKQLKKRDEDGGMRR